MRHILYFTAIVILISCSQVTSSYKEIPIVKLCELPGYKGKEVRIRANYYVLDEYSSLIDPACKRDSLDIELDLSYLQTPLSVEDSEKFRKVTTYYSKFRIRIEAIGIFEDEDKRGYGHLGSNKSNFRVSKIMDVKLIKR